MKLGLTWRVLAAAILVAAVLGATFALLLDAVARQRASERVVTHSFQELAQASRLEQVVIELETGARGYLLTNDVSLLQPWDAAMARYAERTQSWLALVDDPAQRSRALTLANDIFSYVNQYSVPLVQRAQTGDPTASSPEETRIGRERIDEIQAGFEDYQEAESELLTEELSRANAAAERAVDAAVSGIVVSVVITGVFSTYLGLSIVRPVRRAAALAGRVAQGDLSARMPETGAAEMGTLERSFNTMAASLGESQARLRDLAEEQSALRRVATLVAEEAAPARVFQAVTSEISRLLGADVAVLVRYEPHEQMTVVASLGSIEGAADPSEARKGSHDHLARRVRECGHAVTVDAADADAPSLGSLRRHGLGSATAVPVTVENRLWGTVFIAWRNEQAAGSEVEGKVAGFTELVATALATAQSRADLQASRARVVAASDQTRRRIERNLHDGTQQRLVALRLELRSLQKLPHESPEFDGRLARISDGLEAAVSELQEVSRGLHPAILSRGGLGPALKALARRSALPVRLDVQLEHTPPEPVAVGAYYLISEALTNAAKHARAEQVDVRVSATDGHLDLSIRDDGVGGADTAKGSGLIGLRDRVEALGGQIEVTSPPGGGTTVRANIPIPSPASD